MIIKIEKDYFNGLVPEIDSSRYFMLNLGSTSRTALFNFALALGLDKGPTPIKTRNDFTRDEYIEEKYMYRALTREQTDSSKDELVYPIVEQYANSGFGVLADYKATYTDELLLDKLSLEIEDALPAIEEYLSRL